MKSKSLGGPFSKTGGRGGGGMMRESAPFIPPAGMGLYEPMEQTDFSGSDAGMEHRGLSVSSQGGISATFRVPGVITIPSDNTSHNVTVVQLKLDASMSWITVPKVDAKTHLKVGINFIHFLNDIA
jgi:hypothetical protein